MNEWDQMKAEPFRTHQCVHYNSEGRRCRAFAIRNEYACIRHRIVDPVVNIVRSDPFELVPALAGLRDRAQVQAALAEIAARLAARTIDDKRAGLLLYSLQNAVTNLSHPARSMPRILDAAWPHLQRRRSRLRACRLASRRAEAISPIPCPASPDQPPPGPPASSPDGLPGLR